MARLFFGLTLISLVPVNQAAAERRDWRNDKPEPAVTNQLMTLVRLEVILRDVDHDIFECDHSRVPCSGPLDAQPRAFDYRKTS